MRRPCVWRALRSSSSCLRCIPALVCDMAWRASAALDILSYLSFIRVDVNQFLTSITRTSSPRLSLSVASSRECQTILSTELEHFNRKFPLEADNRKDQENLSNQLRPWGWGISGSGTGHGFYRWYPRGSLNHNKVDTNIFNQDATCKMNCEYTPSAGLLSDRSWNVDAGIFLHMLSLVIQVMCSEHFLRTGSGGHSMWSSPWNSVEDECRSQGKSPDVWILTVSWHLKIENREKNQCFDQFSCTWHYCLESSMASGFQGQSLYFAHTLNSQVSRRLLRVSNSLLPLGRGKSSSFIHGWFKWSN